MYHSETVKILTGITFLAAFGLGIALVLLIQNKTSAPLEETLQSAAAAYSTPPAVTKEPQHGIIIPTPSSTPPALTHDKVEPAFTLETPKEPVVPKVIISKPVVTPPLPAPVTPPKSTTPTQPAPIKAVSFDGKAMLDAHNAVRKDKGLTLLTWSNSLALSSQRWGDKLTDNPSCDFYHDPNTEYGENLFWKWISDSDNSGLISTPEDAVTWWAEEEDFYNYTKNTCRRGKDCGHYTQIVWADTTEVGCSVSTCYDKRNDETQTDFWVCRYNPAGNLEGLRPY
jgi:pathogenesis-related protein 1